MTDVDTAPSSQPRIPARGRHMIARASSLALAITVASPALAQPSGQEPQPGGAVSSEPGIGDIVVTARRVEENLQDVPGSVSAITGDDVDRMASLGDLQSRLSGVTFQVIGPIPVVGIRGFGNRSQAGNTSNSAVGIYQDGVFVTPNLSTIINRTDTERVEVAKGPQSTLYGRSSFAGAINIVTADPDDELSGYISVGYGFSSVGGEDLWRAQGAISIPLSDTLSVRFYGLAENRDGYAHDSVTGFRSGGYDRQIGRLRILWEPNADVRVRLTGTVMRDDLPLPLVTAGRIRAPLGQNVVFQSGTPASRAALVFGNEVWDAQLLTPQRSRIRGEQVTLDVRAQTAIGELASLTDYQHSTLDPFFSLDLTRLNWANGSSPFYEERYSQEIRLANTVGRLSYLGGIYYLRSDVEQGGGRAVDPTRPFATFGPGSAQFDFGNVNALFQPSFTGTLAYAAFLQLGYHITDALNLTVGLRYGRDELEGPASVAIRNRVTGAIIPTGPLTNRRASFDAVTGSANLSYEINDDVLVYASYARGNSPGGLNTGFFANQDFGPQNVDAFELGLRSRFLNRRLQLNAALFANYYEGLQLTQNILINNSLNPVVNNAAEARGLGFDIDAIAIISDSLQVNLQYTYVDSEITSYTLPPPPSPQVNLVGVPLVRSPEHSLNASVTFRHDIGPGRFEFTAQQSYTSSYTNDYLGVPAGFAYPGIPGVLPAGVTTTQVLGLFPTRGYSLTNLNASYSWGNFQLSASIRNLFNKQYIATVLAFDLVTNPLEIPGPPRTIEFGLRYNF